MKVGVLGTGVVGSALGKGFATLGHEVMMGARAAGGEKAKAFVAEAGAKASEGTFAEAARFGEVIVFATLGIANRRGREGGGRGELRRQARHRRHQPARFLRRLPA